MGGGLSCLPFGLSYRASRKKSRDNPPQSGSICIDSRAVFFADRRYCESCNR
jgi:hypothetical protein